MHKGIYKASNGSWYIHTTIKGKSVTIRGFDSKKDADDNYDYAIEQWKREHFHVVATELFDDVFFRYLDSLVGSTASRTIDRERTQYNTFWKARFHNEPIKNIYKLDRLRIIYNETKSSNNLNVRKKHDVIKTFLNFSEFCYGQKLISKDTFEDVKIIFQPLKYKKRVTNEHQIIPQCEINRVLQAIYNDNDNLFALAISVLYMGGLRISELLGLLGSDIDLENKKIKVRRQLMTNGQLTEQLKTSNSYRDVPINGLLFKELQKINKNLDNNTRFFDYSHTDFRRKLKRYTDYTAHDFRHTRCFELAKKCQTMSDVVYCAKCMGHSTSIFLNTYCSHLDNTLDEKFFN